MSRTKQPSDMQNTPFFLHAKMNLSDSLGVSIDTVCSHLKHVFGKLHVSSRTEAAVRYTMSKLGSETRKSE